MRPQLGKTDYSNNFVAILATYTAGLKDGNNLQKLPVIAVQGKDMIGEVQDQNVVPGTPEDQDAYRGELSGLYALVCMYKKDL